MRCVVLGGGTMGVGIAAVLARACGPVTVLEPDEARRTALSADVAALGGEADPVAALDAVPWEGVGLVVEAVPENLELKRETFAALERVAPADAILASNSSSFPISRIAEGLGNPQRMAGLHFFMPAHLVPLVEVISGARTSPGTADRLIGLMRDCGKRPVHVRRDVPGFLGNRMQLALLRESLALLEAGVASAEDIDAAVRYGFGARYLAAGPLMQKDLAGLDVHAAAATTIYPTLDTSTEPRAVLTGKVEAGRLGVKAGGGFYDWPGASGAEARRAYERRLRAAIALLDDQDCA